MAQGQRRVELLEVKTAGRLHSVGRVPVAERLSGDRLRRWDGAQSADHRRAVAPAGAVRFASAPQAVAPGAGLTAARGTGAETGSTPSGVRLGVNPQQPPAGKVTSMSGQKPRQGYTDYLRTAGLPQLAGAALPGVAGILLLTLGGGVIGYRQASAGRMVRMSGAARYLP